MSSINDFKIICRLGEGSYSSVHKAIRKSDNQEYAIKRVKMGALKEKERENALNEVRILASIEDPNIVGYKDAFFDIESNCLFVVMEYAGGGDLQKKLKDHCTNKTFISEKEIWVCLIHVASGLRTLHDMKILHRDLKCANIFLNEDGKLLLC